MEHIAFALFADTNRAATAVRHVREAALPATEILLHHGALDPAGFEERIQRSGSLAESDLRHAVTLGGVLGMLLGAGWGVVLWLLGVFPGDGVASAGLGALMGALVGLLMMSIVGTGLVDWRLRRLIKDLHSGEVVLTIRSQSRAAADRAIEILQEDGAQVAEKSMV